MIQRFGVLPFAQEMFGVGEGKRGSPCVGGGGLGMGLAGINPFTFLIK